MATNAYRRYIQFGEQYNDTDWWNDVGFKYIYNFPEYDDRLRYEDVLAYGILLELCYENCDAINFKLFLDNTQNLLERYLIEMTNLIFNLNVTTYTTVENATILAKRLQTLNFSSRLPSGTIIRSSNIGDGNFFAWVLADMDIGYSEYYLCDVVKMFRALTNTHSAREKVINACISAMRNPKVVYEYHTTNVKSDEVTYCTEVIYYLSYIYDMKHRNQLIDFYFNLPREMRLLTKLKETIDIAKPMYYLSREYEEVNNALAHLYEQEYSGLVNPIDDGYEALPRMLLDIMNDEARLNERYQGTKWPNNMTDE